MAILVGQAPAYGRDTASLATLLYASAWRRRKAAPGDAAAPARFWRLLAVLLSPPRGGAWQWARLAAEPAAAGDACASRKRTALEAGLDAPPPAAEAGAEAPRDGDDAAACSDDADNECALSREPLAKTAPLVAFALQEGVALHEPAMCFRWLGREVYALDAVTRS